MHSRLALALLLLSVPAASAESPVASAPATAIDNYLTPFVDTNNFSGVVLVARGGEPVFAKGDLGAHSAREGSLHRPVELRRDASGAITALKYDRFTGEPIKS